MHYLMSVQELRVEALRASVSITQIEFNPTHAQVLDFAEVYFKYLAFGEVPGKSKATSSDRPDQGRPEQPAS